MSNVTLAILAGGRGSRMGSPKDLLRIRGRPILLHLLDQAAFNGPTLLVTSMARPNPVGIEAFDGVAVDAVENAGPTAGIAAALSAASTPWVIVLSCDMPCVASAHVHWLLDRAAEPADLVVGMMCRRNDGMATEMEPFPAIYRTEALKHLSVGGSLKGLVDGRRFVAIDVPPEWPEQTWLNLNRRGDLEQIGATIDEG